MDMGSQNDGDQTNWEDIMKFGTMIASLALAGSLALSASAKAEELSVATFIPPQHHINAFFFNWFGEEVAKRSEGSPTNTTT